MEAHHMLSLNEIIKIIPLLIKGLFFPPRKVEEAVKS